VTPSDLARSRSASSWASVRATCKLIRGSVAQRGWTGENATQVLPPVDAGFTMVAGLAVAAKYVRKGMGWRYVIRSAKGST
jgi:hypothetical protein